MIHKIKYLILLFFFLPLTSIAGQKCAWYELIVGSGIAHEKPIDACTTGVNKFYGKYYKIEFLSIDKEHDRRYDCKYKLYDKNGRFFSGTHVAVESVCIPSSDSPSSNSKKECKSGGEYGLSFSGSAPKSACVKGCQYSAIIINGKMGSVCDSGGCGSTYYMTGESCNDEKYAEVEPQPIDPNAPLPEPDIAPPARDPAKACRDSGGSYGEVNGVMKCIPGSSSSAGNAASAASASGSANTKPKDPDNTNPNGTAGGSNSSTTNNNTTNINGGGGGRGNGSSGSSGGGDGIGALDCKVLNTCSDTSTGAALPGKPKLYEPRYQDGLKGVWAQKSERLKSTGLIGLSRRLMPAFNAGTPPVWEFCFDLPGIGNFGCKDLAPSPSIWAVLRVIVILTASIFAFRMIFGGA